MVLLLSLLLLLLLFLIIILTKFWNKKVLALHRNTQFLLSISWWNIYTHIHRGMKMRVKMGEKCLEDKMRTWGRQSERRFFSAGRWINISSSFIPLEQLRNNLLSGFTQTGIKYFFAPCYALIQALFTLLHEVTVVKLLCKDCVLYYWAYMYTWAYGHYASITSSQHLTR